MKMKPFALWIALLILGSSTILHGQAIDEEMKSMSLGSHNAIVLSIPDYDSKFANDVWRDYIKSFKGKTKKVKRSKEYFTDDARIMGVSTNTVDMYWIINSAGNGSTLTLWTDLGGAFLNSEEHSNEYEGMAVMLLGFEKQLNVENIKVELKAEESELKELEKKLARLEKLNDKYHKEIEDWKRKIIENEEMIEINIQDQASMRMAIDKQKESVRGVEIKLAKAETTD
ncbi:MAG: hypothetical protein OEM26_03710 [Saprospiraceae bacterium]|nr:hypothetical protein [Saprospiraceae bacterium]